MNISDEIFDLTFKNRIPLYTTLEVTYKCNLDCVHCYIPKHYRIKKDLNFEIIKKTIKEIRSLGGMYLVLTGGEPLLRKDIFDIIKYAKKLNFIVLLFTNGTLIDKVVAQKLKIYAVDKVEISLYGNEFVHNQITTHNDSFKKTFSAIKYLKDNGIKVVIKFPLMKQNYNDYKYLKKFAKEYDVEYKFDFVLTPRNDGDPLPQKYMISDTQIKNILPKKSVEPFSTSFFSNLICSAGRNIVGISADGEVYPCLQFPYSIGNIKNFSFKKVWNSKQMLKLATPQYFKFFQCKNCSLITICNRCPGLAFIETKSLYKCSPTAKKISKILSSKYKVACDKNHT
jgi:radical SAM protein with 4Fe4S-binding SPASM domain